MSKGLCISRRQNQSVYIGDDIVVTVETLDSGSVGLRISAPADMKIHRDADRVRSPVKLAFAASRIKD